MPVSLTRGGAAALKLAADTGRDLDYDDLRYTAGGRNLGALVKDGLMTKSEKKIEGKYLWSITEAGRSALKDYQAAAAAAPAAEVTAAA